MLIIKKTSDNSLNKICYIIVLLSIYYTYPLYKYNWSILNNIQYCNFLLTYVKKNRIIRRKRLWKISRFTKNLMFKFFKKNKFNFKNIYRGKIFSLNYSFKLKRLFMRWKRYNYKIKTKKIIFKLLSKRAVKKIKFNFIKYISYSGIVSRINLTTSTNLSIHRRILLNMSRVSNTLLGYFYKKTKYNLLKRGKLSQKFKSFDIKCSRSTLLNYVFKKTTITKNKVIMLNYYKKLLWKIRKSRITHWDLKKTGTLNKSRYKKLFYSEIKRPYLFKKFQELFVVFLLNSSCISLSWRQVLLMEKYQLFLVNNTGKFKEAPFNKGDIIEICYGSGLAKHSKLFRYFNRKIIFRLKRWSYRSYITYSTKKPNKKVPKGIKSIGLGYKLMGKLIMTNRGIGVSTIVYELNDNITHPLIDIYRTTVLKLNNWRYRFN